ncbi:MAG: Valine--tRNA ligase, mitochondrial [Sclerophora amabilis]|nr:MAG: Valine--tRNA ligase, mitochondrial [Sclerophora amabilis]
MATNSASSNPIGDKTGPISGKPPSASAETKAAISNSSNADPTGQSQGGQDGGPGPEGAEKVKTEKELEKDRKKAEKAKKFAEKKIKTLNASNAPGASKNQAKKAKADAAKEEPLAEYVEETPAGQKKILKSFDDPLYKAYNPTVVESAWDSWWEKEGFFKPEFDSQGEVKKEGYFSIAVPPPNVTGALHMGHALTNALQDTMIRWSRMRGLTTLWLPGCDHAGIATQSVVENMLRRRQNKSRHDLGREKFTDLIWDWKEEYHTKINAAHKKMGVSFDWTREAFTMDENLSAAVTETFVQLHDEGIIYRANRLVNWCTKLNTAISNLEVDNKELEGRTLIDVPGYDRKVEFGVITHFQYQIDDSEERIEVATTRPETMLGDTGIAVHPKDERYRHLVGKSARHPFVDRLLPIFADEYVDPEFGTGAVKITPAHDPNDFTLGSRHNLEFINILTDDGTMNSNTGKYEGTKRFDARYSVVEDLKARGLYVRKEDNPMKVPLCSRSKDVIEPVMKPQWWMRMRELADAAIKVVKDGEIKIRPESAEKDYYRWLGGINDWCISRQLWWGHRAPVYFVQLEGETTDDGEGHHWVAGRTPQEAEEKAKAKFPGKRFELRRDEDVLDTWFSSALWPFSTLGWPKKTHDYAKLYPTSILETGWDILFFWVTRMIMLGVKMTGQVPFREVYCHSLIRDSEGRKMSKSLGNVIDPQDVITGIPLQGLHDKLALGNLDPKEMTTATKFQKAAFPDGIPQCGADAVRFSLISYTTGGGDINFDVRVIYGYRKFCNKIYQATKYVLRNLEKEFVPQKRPNKTGKESLSERWILHKYTVAAKEINQALADREFQKSTLLVYQYWYNHLCDVYIENSKTIIQEGTEEEQQSAINTLYTALEGALTLIHPFMPFLTEELWQRLPRRPDDSTPSIVKASYPTYDASLDDPASEAAYELVLSVSKGVRSLMSEYSIRDDGKLFIQAYDHVTYQTAKDQLQSIKSLSGKGIGSIDVLSKDEEKPTGCVVFAVSSGAAVFLHVKGRVDIDAEINKAKTKLQKASEVTSRQQQILNDPKYQEKVSKELQEVERRKLADSEAEMRNYEESIQHFERLKLE